VIVLAPGVEVPDGELQFRASRSGGPGGQNVNKVATRIELFFDLAHSPSIRDDVRQRLLAALATHIDGEGVLRIVAASERSQLRNREEAVARLQSLCAAALRPRKRRKKTKPTRGSKERRLKEKKARSETKARRREF
jgi:ribosome-associated protein